MQSICADLDYSSFPPSISVSLKENTTTATDLISPLMIDQDGSGEMLEEPLKIPCGQFFDDVVLDTGSLGSLRIIEYGLTFSVEDVVGIMAAKVKTDVTEVRASEYISFPWAAPYFCSEYGSRAWVHTPPPYISRQRPPLFSTPYVDDEGQPLAAAWDVVDELQYRLGLTSKDIQEGKFEEIGKGVKRIIEEERARMLPK